METGGTCFVPRYIKLTTGTSWVGVVDYSRCPTDGLVVDYCRVWQNPDYRKIGF